MNNIGNRKFWGWYNCVSAKMTYLEIRDSAIGLYWCTVCQNRVYNKMCVLSPKYWYESFGKLLCYTHINVHCTIKILKHLHYYVNLQTRPNFQLAISQKHQNPRYVVLVLNPQYMSVYRRTNLTNHLAMNVHVSEIKMPPENPVFEPCTRRWIDAKKPPQTRISTCQLPLNDIDACIVTFALASSNNMPLASWWH